ncbi:ribbon-helix-helix domain-containing protein [Metabacillus sp. SLBN-84]
MSTKNSLKDKIKKPNATQAFFNSYEKETPAKETESPIDKSDSKTDNVITTKDIVENEIDNNNNTKTYDDNDNIDNVVDEDDDYLRSLVSGKKTPKRKAKKVFTSFYMEPELAVEVDKIASRGEKGDKSKLINAAIRKLLEEYGVIQK